MCNNSRDAKCNEDLMQVMNNDTATDLMSRVGTTHVLGVSVHQMYT